MYPENDNQFEETTIANVEISADGGWHIKREEGWSFFVPKDSPVVPEMGMSARFYGKGIGYIVRGLFINGVQVFYRTEEEDEQKHRVDSYGADCADWLARWDAGRTCWSIEMGGLGPGYEQCIHITMAEILRVMLDKKFDVNGWADKDQWKADLDQIEKAVHGNPTIEKLGLSGAQWSAAVNLAGMFYRNGPIGVMTDPRVKDRHIQVQRTFPSIG